MYRYYLLMAREKLGNDKQTHIRTTPGDRRKITHLGKGWGLKSVNAIVLECIRDAYESMRNREAARKIQHVTESGGGSGRPAEFGG